MQSVKEFHSTFPSNLKYRLHETQLFDIKSQVLARLVLEAHAAFFRLSMKVFTVTFWEKVYIHIINMC